MKAPEKTQSHISINTERAQKLIITRPIEKSHAFIKPKGHFCETMESDLCHLNQLLYVQS